MNAKQSNLLETLVDTHAFLTTTRGIGALTALTPKVAQLMSHIDNIRAHAHVQALPTHGAIRERDQAVEAAIELTLAVAGALRSYAETHQLPELAALAAVTRRTFSLLRKGQRMRVAQRVLDAARPLAAALADYGVTAALLDEFDAKIAAGNAIVGTPRTVAAKRKAATRELAGEFAAAGRLLRNGIDPMIETLRVSDPVAYARYHDARSVFDRPGVRRRGEDEKAAAVAIPTAAPVASPPAP